MIRTVVNLLLFNAGWFACILAAAHGVPWMAVWAVTVIAAAHVFLAPHAGEAIRLFVIASVVGYAFDSIVVLGGFLTFPPQAQLGGPSPIWMVAMWVNLAGVLRVALGWLRERWLLAAAVGAVSGPLAYWGGERLGAVVLPAPEVRSLAAIAVEWGIALPLLYVIERWTRTTPAGDAS